MVDLKVDLIVQLVYFWWRLNTVNVLWLFLTVGWSAVCDCAISWSYPLFNKLLLKLQTSYIKMNLITFLTGGSKAVLLLWIFLWICILCLSASFLQPCGHLLGKGWPLGCLVCDVFLFFLSLSHMVSWIRCGIWLYQFLIFPVFLTWNSNEATLSIRKTGSGVVLDCINSWYFLSSLLEILMKLLCQLGKLDQVWY